jgi:phage terminase, small subunit
MERKFRKMKNGVLRIWKGGAMAKISKKKIREDLINQLEERGLEKMSHYVSLVDDYCRLWEVKDMLFDDITKRGVNVPYNNGGGQQGYKRNDSVSELTRVNAQMLKILSELGLRGADIEAKEEEVEL